MRHKRLVFTLGPTLLLLTPLVLAHEPILSATGDFLVVEDEELQPADMIHALSGSDERIDYGVQLYHRGLAPRLFLSACGTDQERAAAGGVPREDLFPDTTRAHTTYEEAVELKEFLDQTPSIRSLIVVSSPYHMRRAQWTFKKVLGDRVRLQFAPVPFELSSHEQRWWTDGRLRKVVLKEYLANLVYFVKYSFR